MLMQILIRLGVVVLILVALGLGLVDYLKNVDENECSMTYMKQPISLIPVNLDPKIQEKFPFYKLYLYCESFHCHQYETLKFTRTGEIPVLFITGNADSHKQVRSLASIASHKALKSKYSKRDIRFHYFTIDFNEELSAVYGPILISQTEYAKHCIKHILALFGDVKPVEKRPKSVLVVGNSMGGLVARGIFLRTETPFNPNWVNTIITEATPHQRPVVNLDKKMSDFYDRVNGFWLNKNHTVIDHVVLVSLYGGVRDILVRSGLSNLKELRNQSGAKIISSYTVSMPKVWRSSDHRCMVWCRELIMAINRALFNMLDPKTDQLIEDRDERERILRRHFERDFLIEGPDSTSTQTSFAEVDLIRIKSEQDAFFSWNDFNSKPRLMLFKLESLINSFDSLFLYTNINSPNTVLACKEFDSEKNECRGVKNLLAIYGQSIPPYIENLKHQGLKTMNLNGLKSELVDQGYEYIIVYIPVLTESQQSRFQLVLKLDWYRQEDRFERLKKRSPIGDFELYWTRSDAATLRRYYLDTFICVWQAFELANVGTKKCDSLILQNADSLNMLSSSNVLVQFHEPVSYQQANSRIEHIYHTQAIQGKTKNITLRLTVNHHNDLVPYIDVIRMDPEHIIPKWAAGKKEAASKIVKCLSESRPRIEVEFNYAAMLGQLVRFYLPLIPAFLVAILQMYDFSMLLLIESRDELHSKLMLNYFNSSYLSHLIYSYILALVIYLLPYFGNDYEHIKTERIENFMLGFILYWAAYALFNAVCLFTSLNHTLFSFLVNKIVLPLVSCLNFSFARKLATYLHFVLTCVACIYSSALVHCILFYTIVVHLALNNPAYNRPPYDYIRYLSKQTRFFFLYLLLVLNLPMIIVWAKALSSDGGSDFRPLYAMMGDSGHFVASVSIFIYLIYSWSERVFEIKANYFSLNSIVLALLVLINSVATVLYSTLNVYRLQYFVLMHLFLMCFMPRKPIKFKSD